MEKRHKNMSLLESDMGESQMILMNSKSSVFIIMMLRKGRVIFVQKKITPTKPDFCKLTPLTLRCPSLSLHAERVSWMYQLGNKHENCANQIINRGNNTAS